MLREWLLSLRVAVRPLEIRGCESTDPALECVTIAPGQAPKPQEQASATEEKAPATEEKAPATKEKVPATEEKAPMTDGQTSVTVGEASETAKVTLETEDLLPNGPPWRWRVRSDITPELAAELMPTAIAALVCTILGGIQFFLHVYNMYNPPYPYRH